jgi:hypothetical protein
VLAVNDLVSPGPLRYAVEFCFKELKTEAAGMVQKMPVYSSFFSLSLTTKKHFVNNQIYKRTTLVPAQQKHKPPVNLWLRPHVRVYNFGIAVMAVLARTVSA